MATRIPVIRLESNDEPRIRFEEDQWLMSPLNKHDRHRLSGPLDRWKGPPGVDFRVLLAADRWIPVLGSLDRRPEIPGLRPSPCLAKSAQPLDIAVLTTIARSNPAPTRRTGSKSV